MMKEDRDHRWAAALCYLFKHVYFSYNYNTAAVVKVYPR